MPTKEAEARSRRDRDRERRHHRRSSQQRSRKLASPSKFAEGGPISGSHLLSADALAQLNRENVRESTKHLGRQRPKDGETPHGGTHGNGSESEREKKRSRRRREREVDKDKEVEGEKMRERRRVRIRERAEEKERIQRRQERSLSRTRPRTAVTPSERPEDREIMIKKPRTYRRSEQTPHDDDDHARRPKKQKTVPQQYIDNSSSRRGGRAVSGAVLEEGKGFKAWRNTLRGGGRSKGTSTSYDSLSYEDIYEIMPTGKSSRKRRLWIYVGIGVVVVLILIIVIAVVVSKKKSKGDDDSRHEASGSSGLESIAPESIPPGAPSWLNPFVWADTTDFNLTYTDETVGGLPLMGLRTSWDDSAAANEHVPALQDGWGSYATGPARGVNLGGWLSLEPFITPSLFAFPSGLGVVDEYTLCKHLGPDGCARTLENHYATFVSEQTFREIAEAGLDHVRIPYSYWAVEVYPGDPYVHRTSWRYLLRGIEWARRHGLRVNLDLHALPGSQNGWNHSGRLGPIGWLNGTDGDLNARRSLQVHDRLTKFFAQARYRHVLTHYGLANEPRMTFLSVPAVLDWTTTVRDQAKKNGLTWPLFVFGDGFRGLAQWQGEMTSRDDLVLDVHQYVIFNTNQIVYNHTQKIAYACDGWTDQTLRSLDKATGFGPTMVAEWSQADTDCQQHLTNVGWGNRWTGTYVTGNASEDITRPRCPTEDSRCTCRPEASVSADGWSEPYKRFLKMFAEAQMTSFEKGWGWWYWVWDTESAPQWSYKKGLAAGVLPAKAYDKSFRCDADIPTFSDLPEYY